MKPTTIINRHHKLPYDLYIGRGTKWENPFSHMENTTAQFKVETREQAVEAYREWIQTQPHLLESLPELKGKVLCCSCKLSACHGDILVELVNALPKKTLHCYSKGDIRFSAFGAKVKMWGKIDSIENHYQLAKRFEGEPPPRTWREAKGKKATHIHLNGHDYEKRLDAQWYKLLWLRYLDTHPELVSYASQFDDFLDIFKGKSVNCQSDVIQQYVEEGRESVWNDCQELWNLFMQNKKK